MRLATLRLGRGTRAAVVDGAATRLLPYDDVGTLLGADRGLVEARRGGRPGPALADADLAPVVPRPRRVLGVGLNYRSHIAEMGREVPRHPTVFAKLASTLTGPDDPIPLDPAVGDWDWEAELAVVVGRTVRRADAAEARDAIAGYAVANDVSARDWQLRTSQWLAGKAWDATTPLGPVLVTSDELDVSELTVTCSVDGVEKQRAATADLLFAPEELVSYISRFTTLEPGDVLLTGTPGGVGAGRTPPERLRPGQVLETRVDAIGACRNVCVEG